MKQANNRGIESLVNKSFLKKALVKVTSHIKTLAFLKVASQINDSMTND